LLPIVFAFSAPTTKTESQSPDTIYEKAEIMAFVPELQRLSILFEILGFSPSISDIILELYCSFEHEENRTASTSRFDKLLLFFKIWIHGSQAKSNMDESDHFVNFAVSDDTIPTLGISKG
jgi:hypothetical protein